MAEAFFRRRFLGGMTRNSPGAEIDSPVHARTESLHVYTYCTMMTTQRHHRRVNRETREHFYRRRRQSVPAAREFTRAALADWGIGGAQADDIALCVTELVTNALLHGVPPGRGFRLCLRYDAEGEGVLRVEVHDSGGGVPEVVCPEDESGRGLLLVAALCDAWGVTERDPGKVVWCQWTVEGAVTTPGRRRPTTASR